MEALCKAMYLQLYREIKNGFSFIAIMIIAPFLLFFQIIRAGTSHMRISKGITILMLALIFMIALCIFAIIQLG